MEKKIVSFKQIKYEKMYVSFYKDVNNRNLALNCFFNKKDITQLKSAAKIG